jgi:3-oxoacyl-[acyl-carrier protein] reductase
LGAIGYATAAKLASLGARCLFLHRGSTSAVDWLAGLPGRDLCHVDHVADLLDSAHLRSASEFVRQRCGRCDMLVNSAGRPRTVPLASLQSLTDEVIDDMLRLNLRTAIATIREFIPLLIDSGVGLIVNVSSIAARTAAGSNRAYIAAKAGLDAASRARTRAFAPQVRVVTVCPGAVESSFVSDRGKQYVSRIASYTPPGRIGFPEEAAAAIAAIATSLRFATGCELVVDGGRALR